MEETFDLNRNDRNNTFNMQFLNNKRPPAAKPERQLAADLRPVNSQRRPFPRRPLKHLCKYLSINSVKPSQTQSNHAFGWGGDSLSPQHSPSMGPQPQRKTPGIPFVIVIRHFAPPILQKPQNESAHPLSDSRDTGRYNRRLCINHRSAEKLIAMLDITC